MSDPSIQFDDPRGREPRRFPARPLTRNPVPSLAWSLVRIVLLASVLVPLPASVGVGPRAALAQEPETERGTETATSAEVPPEAPPEMAPESAGLPEGSRELAARIESDYEVLPVRGGVVLRPVAEDAPFRALEIRDDGLAVDGEPVDEEALRERLGEAAEPVLRLVEMTPGERRRVLGMEVAPEEALEAPERTEAVEAPERPEQPERHRVRTGDKVSLVGGVTIKKEEIAKDVVVVAGPLRVYGVVDGGAVVVGGNAYIDGEVRRELTVAGGNVYLGPESRVDGDINIMAGGRVHRQPGAEVTGRVNELGVVGPVFGGDDIDLDIDFHRRFRPLRWFSGVMGGLFWLVTLALLACLAVLFGQRAVEGIGGTLAADPWRSGAVGLVFQLLFLPLLVIVILLLVMSIIGIPLLLLLPFALLGLVGAGFVGYVAVSLHLGRRVLERFGRRISGPYLPVIVGVMVIGIWGVLSEALDLPFLQFFSALLTVVAIVAFYAAWTFGGGALLLRLAARRRERRAGLSPPPPPAPPTTASEATPTETAPEESPSEESPPEESSTEDAAPEEADTEETPEAPPDDPAAPEPPEPTEPK